jgi:hypothetical protein
LSVCPSENISLLFFLVRMTLMWPAVLLDLQRHWGPHLLGGPFQHIPSLCQAAGHPHLHLLRTAGHDSQCWRSHRVTGGCWGLQVISLISYQLRAPIVELWRAALGAGKKWIKCYLNGGHIT